MDSFWCRRADGWSDSVRACRADERTTGCWPAGPGDRRERRRPSRCDGDRHQPCLAGALGNGRHRRTRRVPSDATAHRDLHRGICARRFSNGPAGGPAAGDWPSGEVRQSAEAGVACRVDRRDRYLARCGCEVHRLEHTVQPRDARAHTDEPERHYQPRRSGTRGEGTN